MAGDAADLLLRMGPLLLFAMAMAETAVPLGLMVPAGVAFSTGIFLAYQGLLGWEAVVACALAGALAGDSFGYWLGRTGPRLLRRVPWALDPAGQLRHAPLGRLLDAPLGRLVSGVRRRTRRIFRSYALIAVTGGRTVPGVRTFMPATAGASGITYLRFLAFDGIGVAAWACLYVALGLGTAVG